MDRLFWVTLVIIVSLGVRLALEMVGQPKQLAEPLAMLGIMATVALALVFTWVYTLTEMLAYFFSLTMIFVLLLGVWFYVLQPLADSTETNYFQGLNLGGWNVRWDYFALILLAAPVFLLILTYNHFASLFDFALSRVLPLLVLGFIYFYAIVKRW